MGISYDVDQDEPSVDHATGVKAIPPSPVSIPKAPPSILEQQEDPYKRVFGVDGNAGSNPLNSLGAILASAWRAEPVQSDKIVGRWAEDDTPYEITVPAQLRDPIIAMQNTLFRKYAMIQEFRTKLARMESEFKSMLGM